MSDKREALIDAWLKETAVLINHRMVEGLSFNEAFVCNLLNRERKAGTAEERTATWLCGETGILKSQMNKTLNSLEKKGVIERVRSEEDRRKVYIRLKEENLEIYAKAHEDILNFAGVLSEHAGEETIDEAVALLNRMAELIRHMRKGDNGWEYRA